MQNLKPTIDNIKRLYGDDKKKVQRETSELYKKAQISPLAGGAPLLCLLTPPALPLELRTPDRVTAVYSPQYNTLNHLPEYNVYLSCTAQQLRSMAQRKW